MPGDKARAAYFLACEYRDHGHLADAKAMHAWELPLRRRVHHGEDSKAVVKSLVALGAVCRELGEAEEACAVYTEAVDMLHRIDKYQRTHLLAGALSELGVLHTELGHLDKAEEALTEARQKYELMQMRHFNTSSDVARTTLQLAKLYAAQKRPQYEVDSMFRVAGDLVERAERKSGHQEEVKAATKLAHALAEGGDLNGAREQWLKVLAHLSRVYLFGVRPEVLEAKTQLGWVCERLGLRHLSEAAARYNEALDMCAILFDDPGHPTTQDVATRLARVLCRMGGESGARAVLQKHSLALAPSPAMAES